MAAVVLLSTTACQSQINNAKTETVKVYGNCGMCETTIEKAANKKKISKSSHDVTIVILILSQVIKAYISKNT